MEAPNEKHNDATFNRPEGARTLDAPIVRINIADNIRRIKDETAWQNSDRNAITLLHNDYQRIVLVALKENAEMKRHAIDAALSIQVLSGRLWVESESQSFSVDEDEMAALQPGIPHYVFAEEESVFLLFLSGNDIGEF